jgi:hypothetical protein
VRAIWQTWWWQSRQFLPREWYDGRYHVWSGHADRELNLVRRKLTSARDVV